MYVHFKQTKILCGKKQDIRVLRQESHCLWTTIDTKISVRMREKIFVLQNNKMILHNNKNWKKCFIIWNWQSGFSGNVYWKLLSRFYQGSLLKITVPVLPEQFTENYGPGFTSLHHKRHLASLKHYTNVNVLCPVLFCCCASVFCLFWLFSFFILCYNWCVHMLKVLSVYVFIVNTFDLNWFVNNVKIRVAFLFLWTWCLSMISRMCLAFTQFVVQTVMCCYYRDCLASRRCVSRLEEISNMAHVQKQSHNDLSVIPCPVGAVDGQSDK